MLCSEPCLTLMMVISNYLSKWPRRAFERFCTLLNFTERCEISTALMMHTVESAAENTTMKYNWPWTEEYSDRGDLVGFGQGRYIVVI